MSESDDTDVLLLIPNDFFAVDDRGSPDRRSSNLISFSSIKMNESGIRNPPPAEPIRSCTDFDQYCTENFESSLRNDLKQSASEKNILQEIDSYLNQVQLLPPRHCPVRVADDCNTPSEIPSLRELWQTDNVLMQGGGGNKSGAGGSLMEERLRRKHLERNLEAVQMELIEAQQKVNVALNVDQAKDVAIAKLRATVKVLHNRQEDNENVQRRLDEEREEKEAMQGRCRELEVELKARLERSKTLIETNEVLEEKVKHLTTATNDIREINKKQIEDLQVRLSNSLKAEQLINDDLVRTRNQLVIEKNCHRENQEMWSRKEGNFKSELETLRASLKHFYQKQLNDVVEQKVRDFQKQMDDLEVNFKMDYLRRERQIAERAIEQMELIFRKNEEEVHLLTEKHREEIKFIQLQLELAQSTISEAQQRLVVHAREEQEQDTRQERKDAMRFKFDSAERSPKKLNNKTPIKKSFNEKANSPELQGYIETVSGWVTNQVILMTYNSHSFSC